MSLILRKCFRHLPIECAFDDLKRGDVFRLDRANETDLALDPTQLYIADADAVPPGPEDPFPFVKCSPLVRTEHTPVVKESTPAQLTRDKVRSFVSGLVFTFLLVVFGLIQYHGWRRLITGSVEIGGDDPLSLLLRAVFGWIITGVAVASIGAAVSLLTSLGDALRGKRARVIE